MRQVSGRQGHTVTNLSGKSAYESFCPSSLAQVIPLNPDVELTRVLSACSLKVGELEGMSRFLPQANLYLAMYVRKEALLSAQIEGTQCTLDDVLSSTVGTGISRDVGDVVNYIAASEYAVELMDDLPICSRLLKEVHRILLKDARGSDREPGELRMSQNWVGPSNSTIATAPYVPPNPDDMRTALSDLERFINSESAIDPIAKAALIHYQFETIHPFLDGNGRLGRLLITLSLMNDGVLAKPLLYPSYQLKLRRNEYYDWLTRVRETGDYEGWVKFFCECLLASAEDAIGSLMKLVECHDESESQIRASMGRARPNAIELLRLLESYPILNVPFISEKLGVGRSTANTLVKDFCRLGILRQSDETRQRYRSFVYERYLAILREGGDPLSM